MFGAYQRSELRIEVDASSQAIARSLTQSNSLKQWLWPQQIVFASPREQAYLKPGQVFKTELGVASITHSVELVEASGLRLLLSGSVDGFHEWQWGEGWVQSRLEGVSLLPLNLGNSASLFRLRRYLESADVLAS